MFRIFWQVWIGEIGKKDYQYDKKYKKKTNIKRWNLWIILDFKCIYFLEKYSIIFQNSLIKSLIHKIKKNIKISRICWQVQIGEIGNKKSKIEKKKHK